MKKEVISPILPRNIDKDTKIFYESLLKMNKDLRRDASESLSGITANYEISDVDYTITYNNNYVFKDLTEARVCYFPKLPGDWRFTITNLSDYTIECTPDGTDLINDWNTTFDITENGGKIEVISISDRWLVMPLNDACVYEVSSETADTGLTLNNTWDDVTGMILLNGIYGKGYLSARGYQYGVDTSLPSKILLGFGIGKTSGNNAPNIADGYDTSITLIANTVTGMGIKQYVPEFEYTSDGSQLYMKAKIETDELNATTHAMYGASKLPMYIKFRRTY